MRKSIIMLFFLVGLLSNAYAQDFKLQIDFNKNAFKAGEDITFRVNIYDSNNNLIYDEVNIILEDIERLNKIEKNINSRELININLGGQAKQGQWRVLLNYKGVQTKETFFIEADEKISFILEEDILTIKNTGNIKTNKEIQIMIGEVVGESKLLVLDLNEEERYRLIAPDGEYDIRVLSEGEILFSRKNVMLKGSGLTGKAIGALNEETSQRNPLTGGIAPKSGSNEAFLSYLRESKISYIFILVVFGATILLIIERRYTKKLIKK